MNKTFKLYSSAYDLYSDIVAGRDPDRKNATITYEYKNGDIFTVWWEKKI